MYTLASDVYTCYLMAVILLSKLSVSMFCDICVCWCCISIQCIYKMSLYWLLFCVCSSSCSTFTVVRAFCYCFRPTTAFSSKQPACFHPFWLVYYCVNGQLLLVFSQQSIFKKHWSWIAPTHKFWISSGWSDDCSWNSKVHKNGTFCLAHTIVWAVIEYNWNELLTEFEIVYSSLLLTKLNRKTRNI